MDSIVVIEKNVIMKTTFRETIAVMFASYYVFNLSYPVDISASLEFIQR